MVTAGRRWIGLAIGGAGAIGVGGVFALRVVLGTLGLAGVAAACYWLTRCGHKGRLGLLPPMTDADGVAQPAHWYCSDCGRSWPAHFERDSTPIQRYAGYDPSKLPQAARRAAQLDRRLQVLAVQRAGITAPRAEAVLATPAPAAAPATVAHIDQRRRA
jgi:hypothetical protein